MLSSILRLVVVCTLCACLAPGAAFGLDPSPGAKSCCCTKDGCSEPVFKTQSVRPCCEPSRPARPPLPPKAAVSYDSASEVFVATASPAAPVPRTPALQKRRSSGEEAAHAPPVSLHALHSVFVI